jgi:hypothetical protein
MKKLIFTSLIAITALSLAACDKTEFQTPGSPERIDRSDLVGSWTLIHSKTTFLVNGTQVDVVEKSGGNNGLVTFNSDGTGIYAHLQKPAPEDFVWNLLDRELIEHYPGDGSTIVSNIDQLTSTTLILSRVSITEDTHGGKPYKEEEFTVETFRRLK